MEEIIKQGKDSSQEEFKRLLSEDLKLRSFKEGEVIEGTVSEIGKKFIWISLNLKSEGAIPIEEFKLANELGKLKVNQKIEVLLEKLENRSGDVVVSREKARKAHAWKRMERAFEKEEEVTGTILSRSKGGFIVSVDSCLCFLPGSQVDVRPLKNFDHLMKKPQTFMCVKLDKKRGNIVLSRRAIMEKIRNQDRDKIMSKIKVGDILTGTVKNLTDWGAFIDLQGVDALLHITDVSWSRISRPSEILSLSQSLKVKVIKIDPDTKKISVGCKQLSIDPYTKEIENFKVGETYEATVSKIMDFGAFAQLAPGLEGLIHQSELSWTKKNISPQKVLSSSQRIRVQILEKDLLKRRISLSYKNIFPNPFKKFIKEYKVNDIASGSIVNITEYALFLSIGDSELTGMMHKNDIDWMREDIELTKKFRKGENMKFRILEIDRDKEKIRLGKKQILPDPWKTHFENKKVSDVVTAIVESTSKNGIYVYVGSRDFPIFIKKNLLASESENARPSRFIPGQKVDALIIDLQKKERKISLSIKDLEIQQDKKIIKKYGSRDSGMQLGDLLGPLLKKNKEKSKK